MPLRALFEQTATVFTSDQALIDHEWQRIETQHQDKSRHYHTLEHLTTIACELNKIKNTIDDWEAIVFATFFHDFVYNVLRKDNEIKSAGEARKFLMRIEFPAERIHRVAAHIEATAGHTNSANNDTNLFTDADLVVLGSDTNEYETYRIAIRKEYSWYPDLLYYPGRKKVLRHFLAMENIYKTPQFRSLERQARINLQQELSLLG